MSNLKFKANLGSYEAAQKFLDGANSKTLCYKTVVHVVDGGIAVKHHHTDIVTYNEDGTITLDNGGWHSQTTANRMHHLVPAGIRVFIKQGLMYVDSAQGVRSFALGALTLRKAV
jgi:hypothetical protein